MVVLVLHLLFLELLLFMQGAEAVFVLQEHPVLVVWVAAVLEVLVRESQAQQILVEVAAARSLVLDMQVVQAVQALLSFATPAQFNISLVAQ
jgi:hypothetical protein